MNNEEAIGRAFRFFLLSYTTEALRYKGGAEDNIWGLNVIQ